jgi:hypothetical protein
MIWRLLLASGAVLCVFPVYKSRQNERAGLSSPGTGDGAGSHSSASGFLAP